MLTVLRVKNLAIIDESEVEFGPGLNVVTGETGAGKSILVGALRLVLGARGRPELVRTGADRAEVEALFEVAQGAPVRARLAALGFELEGDELVVRRVVLASGRSRAYVNGRLATATQLAELAAGLVDISSQHQHHSLVDSATHLDFLDAFAGLSVGRARMAEAHGALVVVVRRLAELEERLRAREEREDFLRFQLGEVERLDPEPDELERLRTERERLHHAERLVGAAKAAEQRLYSGDRALCDELSRISQSLGEAAALDPAFAPLAERVETALTELEEVARDLAGYGDGLEEDPDRLEELEGRLAALQRLVRRHGGSLEEVLAFREAAEAELAELDQADGVRAALEEERSRALATAREEAQGLSTARHAAAAELGVAMTAELAELGMGQARVEVAVAPLARGGAPELAVDGARLTATGLDRAEFLIAPNPGEQPRPLRKVASGGELSRALLALKRVLAQVGPAGLYVFDEVDSGVGGAVAEVIGRKLAQVARHHQVLCITHLPQVAAYGQRHFVVEKEVREGRTYSELRRVEGPAREEEVARMAGGVEITDATRLLAAELLEQAAAW